jgi:glucose/arabinose dehydrogenase
MSKLLSVQHFLKKIAPYLLIGLGGLGLAFSLLPADFSPYGLVQSSANRLAGDGAFGLTTAIYANLQRIALVVGLVALLFPLAYLGAQRRKSVLGRRVALTGLVAAAGLAIVLIANLAIGRSNSLVYAQVFGPLPTSTPTPPASPVPTATPVVIFEGPGTWEVFTQRLLEPIAIVSPPDDPSRLFVLEKGGHIRQIRDGTLLPRDFLDLTAQVIAELNSYEQGLLGLAFAPDYASSGTLFIAYINRQHNLVISRFQAEDNRNRADPESERLILGIYQPGSIHNGGTLKFGPDGYLYVSSGDGGGSNAASQSVNTLHGKILRIDVLNGFPYLLPDDNPFLGTLGRDEILVSGLRNPWQFAIDPLNGDLYIGDVGHNAIEEIDFLAADQPSGLNFGWPIKEGSLFTELDWANTWPREGFTDPIWEYEHGARHCAVVAGEVYRGAIYPELEGMFLFGDFCSGFIWGLERQADGSWQHKALYDLKAQITSFGVDSNGYLYLTDFLGRVWRLEP